MKKLIALFSVVALTGFAGCQKGPGEGGNSSIKGTVWVRDFNANFTVLNGSYAGYDEDVYIIYGDDVSYGDRIRTNYDGEFEFKYLRPGKYTVYMYSKDSTMQSQSGDITIVKEVEISGKKTTAEVPKITIYK